MTYGDDQATAKQGAGAAGIVLPRADFAFLADVEPIHRSGEHGGDGPIVFRRMLEGAAFDAAVDFVDVTCVPPGSKIGTHSHVDSEEIYIVLAGEPLIEVQGKERRLRRGDIAVVHPGGTHALRNDTDRDVTIAVVQMSLAAR